MINFTFIVPSKIQGKARARTVVNNYTGKAHSFTPEATQSYENLIRWCYENCPDKKHLKDKPFNISIRAYFKVPNSYSKKKKELCYNNKLAIKKKPDLDNILKVVLDALNGIAYDDDKNAQIIYIKKLWANKDEGEHLNVCIYENIIEDVDN